MGIFKFQDRELYVWAVIYFVLTALLHWRLQWTLDIAWYGLGAVIGLHLLPFMEQALKMEPSPLRTLLAQLILVPLTFFVLTSSGFVLGKGVVMFFNLVYVYLQQKEFKATKSLASWFSQLKVVPPQSKQQWYLYALAGIFVIETVLFILV